MENNREKNNINITLNENHIKLVGIMFLFFLLTSNKKSPSKFNLGKFNLREIDDVELERKCRLLNRIKGYMKAEEQHTVHRAEVILEILGKMKSLIEGPELHSAEVQYHSLSLEDRKRNMLLDLSKHMEGEHRDIIHTAIDLDIKARTIEKKIRELNNLAKDGITLQNVEKLIELAEPLLEGEMKSKTKDIKKITSALKLMKSIDEKGSLDENDLIEVISPYIEPQQRDSLMKMVQIAKAVSSTMNNNEEKQQAPKNEVDKEQAPNSNDLEKKINSEDLAQDNNRINKNIFIDNNKEGNT
ncbi:hypothetical protein SAMN05446037_102460 [Anaerovirgula multivorans]|uniref:Uncharacterized protein n=1 Tax=Anaerovirgula multivorans TaxID=312168 RepID=A0A239HYD5_9FIRM|nr:hypothetical protein [Anaerovirgula multivorans]SNS86239.1 hypothetical protein SAMN05446037_102460 [Anaerovirgula multivorans]